MTKPAKKTVTILVSEKARQSIDSVVTRLKTAGLTGARCQRSIGTITGQVVDVDVARLRAVEGVEAVETAAEFQLPSPDEPV